MTANRPLDWRNYQFTDAIPEFVPGFFGFGDDGGDEFFAFDTRSDGAWQVFAIPFVPMEIGSARPVAGDFLELLGHVVPHHSPA